MLEIQSNSWLSLLEESSIVKLLIFLEHGSTGPFSRAKVVRMTRLGMIALYCYSVIMVVIGSMPFVGGKRRMRADFKKCSTGPLRNLHKEGSKQHLVTGVEPLTLALEL